MPHRLISRLMGLLIVLAVVWGPWPGHAATTDTGDPMFYTGPNALEIGALTIAGVPVAVAGASGSEYAAARLATTGNITLSGEQTIDGVLTAGSAVVVWLQTNAAQNGIYLSGISSWQRRTDLDVAAEFVGNKAVFVQAGTRYAGTVFRVANTTTVTVGTTAISLIPEPAQWHVSAVQSLASGGTITCASPAGQYVGVSTTVIGLGGPVGLGVPQIAPGTRTNQLCRIQGTDDINTVEMTDGEGVLLAQADSAVLLDARSTITLQWSGTVWRQIDQLGLGGASTEIDLQDACDTGASCGWTNLTQTRPLTFRGTPGGPYELLYELGGNLVHERFNADNTPAPRKSCACAPTRASRSKRFWAPRAPSWQTVASMINVGGLSMSTTGILATTDAHIADATAAHAASAISFAPAGGISATTVQDAIIEVAAVITGGGARRDSSMCNGPALPSMRGPASLGLRGTSRGPPARNRPSAIWAHMKPPRPNLGQARRSVWRR